jgi:hypothetical protein
LNIKACSSKDEDTLPWLNGNTTYEYQDDPFNELIIGQKKSYDNSGYGVDIPLSIPKDFFKVINKLIENKWVDEKTKSVMLTMNFYNPTHDLFLTMRILYENVMPNIVFTGDDYGITDLTPFFNYYLIFSIVSSVVTILLMILSLKSQDHKTKKNNRIKIRPPPPIFKKIKKLFKKIWFYFKNNYRKPDFFESISNKKNLFIFSFYKFRFLLHSSYLPIFSLRFY